MENEQHIPVPPTETSEPQTAPQTEVPEVQVPGLSYTNNAAEADQLPSDQPADPQVSYDAQPQSEYQHQPSDNEYHPTATYDYQGNATPEEYQREERSADAGSFHEEASREDGEARGVKRKHEEGSFDEEDSRNKRPRIEGGQETKQTIFIGNLPPDVTESMLTEIFSSCGKIRDIRLNRHRDTGKVKG